MRRKRNILLWTVTIVYLAVALLLYGLFHGLQALILGLCLAALIVVVLVMKPKWSGLAVEKTQKTPVSVRLPSVFQTELRLVSVDLDRQITILIDRQDFTIGRDPSCDYQFDRMMGSQISRKHAIIHYSKRENAYSICPCHTPNGVRLNHKLLEENRQHVIKKGDLIELANLCFQVESAYA